MLHNPLHLGTGPAGDHWGLYVYWESCTGWGYSSPGKQVWDHWDVLISTAVFFCDADIEPHYCNGIRTSSYWELRNPHKSTSHVLPGLRSINFIAIEYHQPIILGTSEMIFTTYHFRQDWSESDWSNKIQIGYQQSALNCWIASLLYLTTLCISAGQMWANTTRKDQFQATQFWPAHLSSPYHSFEVVHKRSLPLLPDCFCKSSKSPPPVDTLDICSNPLWIYIPGHNTCDLPDVT